MIKETDREIALYLTYEQALVIEEALNLFIDQVTPMRGLKAEVLLESVNDQLYNL